jgi:putative aldouronate transport system permease protein
VNGVSEVYIAADNKAQKIKKKKTSYFRDNYGLYLMLLPAATVYIIFRYVPMYGILMAFQNYNLFAGVFHSEWVGLDVFKEVMSQRTFWQVFLNTLRLNLLSLIVGFPMPVLFALLLNEISRRRFKKIVQTISYMPHFISWVIVYGMLVMFVSKDTGLFNVILKEVGLKQINFLFGHGWWYTFYLGLGIWKGMGFDSIMYLSALSAINTELYEAAEIDGASRLRKTWHVTLPGIRSTIVILLILKIGNITTIGFDQPYLMGNPMVTDIADVLSTYIYRNGIEHAQFSFTTAVGLFQSVINFILLLITDKVARRFGESGLFGRKNK